MLHPYNSRFYYINSVDNLPKNVIKWYSQNVNVKDDRLVSLPIGLENSRWFVEIQKQKRIIEKHAGHILREEAVEAWKSRLLIRMILQIGAIVYQYR